MAGTPISGLTTASTLEDGDLIVIARPSTNQNFKTDLDDLKAYCQGGVSVSFDREGASASTPVLTVRVTGDADKRLSLSADGSLQWGDGTNPYDTLLTRIAAGTLRVGASLVIGLSDPGGSEALRVNGDIRFSDGVLSTILAGKEDDLGNPSVDGHVLSSTTAGVRSWVAMSAGSSLNPRGASTYRLIDTGVTGDATFRLGLYADGTIGWADGAAGVDANLYRSAAGALQTDGTFTAKSTVSVCGLRLSTATASGVGNYLGIAYLSADALVHAETRAVRNGSYSGQTVYEFWLKNGEAGLAKRAWIDSYGYFYSTDGSYSMVMGGAVVGTTNAAAFSLVTSNTTRVTIAADGSLTGFNTSVRIGTDPGGSQKLRVGGDAIINGQIELPSNSAAAVNSLYLHNASGASYATLSVCGTTAYGLPRWIKATVLESIGVGDGDGSLVLSSYFGDFIVETSGRSLTLRYDRAGTLSWVTNGTSGSKLFAATGAGGQTLYGYSDGGGVGITRSTSFSTSSLVYLTGTNIDLYSGAERIAQVISTGFVVGGDPGNNGSYLRSGKGAWIRNNAGANEQVALIDGSAGGQVVFFDAADTMPGGVITDRIIQRWIANGTVGYAYGTIWDVCLGHSSSPVGNGTDRLNNRLVFSARTNADSLASYTYSMVLTGSGGLTVGTADLFLGGSCLQLLSGSVDHCYMGFYPRTATPGTRGAYFGFPGVGSTQLSLVNEIGGGINSYFAGAGHVFGDSVSGDPGGSETIRTSGAARLGSVISARLYAAATNNLHLDAGIGSGAVYLNYYHGTGGVQFCNGAGSVTASVTSGGYATFLGVASTSTSPAVGATQFIAQGYQGGYGAGLSAYSQLAVSGVNTKMGDLVFDGEAAWSSADINTQRAYCRLMLNYKGTIYTPFQASSSGMLSAIRIEAIPTSAGMYGDCNVMLQAAAGGSVAALGFHRPTASGCAIYHGGDGAQLLRLMRWAGGDYRIYHSGTDDVIHRLNEGSGYYQAPDWVEFTQAGQGVYWSHGAGAAIYKASNNYLYVRTSGAVAYVDQSDTIRGYVYHDAGSGNFGLLNAAGTWTVRINSNVVLLDQGVLQIEGTQPYMQLNVSAVGKWYVQWNSGNYTEYHTVGYHRFTGGGGVVIGTDPGGSKSLRSDGDFIFQKTVTNNEAVFVLQNPASASGYHYTSLELSGYYHVGRLVTVQRPTVEVSGSLYIQTKNTANNGWNPGLEVNRLGQVIVNAAGDGSNPNFVVYGANANQGWIRISGADYGFKAGSDYGGLLVISNAVEVARFVDTQGIVLNASLGVLWGSADGAWQLIRVGSDLELQHKQSGSWVTAQTWVPPV